MQTIKVSTTDKGKHHWEHYLMQKQQLRLNKKLSQLEINPWVKRKIIALFKNKITPDNIIPLSQHPINLFIHALIHDQLKTLINNTTQIKTK